MMNEVFFLIGIFVLGVAFGLILAIAQDIYVMKKNLREFQDYARSIGTKPKK